MSPLRDWKDILLGTLAISCRARDRQIVLLASAAVPSCCVRCWHGLMRESLGCLDSRWYSNYTRVCDNKTTTVLEELLKTSLKVKRGQL